MRNAEGESNEHKNQNKSPRTSATEDENVLLFFPRLMFLFKQIRKLSATLGIV